MLTDNELWLAGRQASRSGWVRVSDGSTGSRVFYQSVAEESDARSHIITLERPPNFGPDNPTWADGTGLFMYRGKCSRCEEFVPKNDAAGPVALSAHGGQVALSFLLCRPCLNWLVRSARLELDDDRSKQQPVTPVASGALPPPASLKMTPLVEQGSGGKHRDGVGRGTGLMKVYEDVNLEGAGDILARSRLALSIPKCMYSKLSEQTLRSNRFKEQHADCVKAKAAAVAVGEERRRAARATQMKLRCVSQHGSNGFGDYLCWFSPEGRVDYFGETVGGKAHGWFLAEYKNGSWCLSHFSHGHQHTPEGGRLSTLQYADGIRYHGEMKEGKPHGKGTKTWPDGSEYTGEFFKGKEHGLGTKRSPNGFEETGQFRAGVWTGPGFSTDASGRNTTGTFVDDLFSKNYKKEEEKKGGIIAPAEADITIETGPHNPETLLDLVLERLVELADLQPSLYKASLLMAKVRMCNAPLLPVDSTKISYFLEAALNLKKLTLVGCKLSGEAIGPVADITATSQALEEVDLSWNPIGREGVQAVIAALETAPRLRRLGLAGCRLGADGGQAMIATIGAGKKRFRLLDLDLAHNSLGDGCGEALTIALRRNETLTRLSLRANGLGPEGGLCLAAGIVGNSGALKELVVGDNKLGPRVATLVAASMRSGTSGCLRGFGFPAAARTTIGTSATNTAVEEVTAATEQ